MSDTGHKRSIITVTVTHTYLSFNQLNLQLRVLKTQFETVTNEIKKKERDVRMLLANLLSTIDCLGVGGIFWLRKEKWKKWEKSNLLFWWTKWNEDVTQKQELWFLKIVMPIDTYADSDIWTHTNACDEVLAESINNPMS